MEIKELIDTLRICADGDTICPACPRYEKYKYGGTAECNEKLVLEAAETIESQQKRIAELEAAVREQEERRWIPVTEQLPDRCGQYLCRAKNTIFEDSCYTEILRFERTGFYCRGIRINTVTHWMPLPELPKEDAT